MQVDKLKYIVDNDLCTRCGTCAGVCPVNAITLDGTNYPIVNSLCIGCGKCLKVCPGIDVDFPGLTRQLFEKKFNINDILGFFTHFYAGYALDLNVRANASSGGVITQLLIYLLDKKIIDGAIVTMMNPKAPCESMAVIAKTKDELIQSMQSRYTIVPVNRQLSNIKQMKGKFALVGLPCHIHGFWKLANIDPNIKEKIFLTLGLFCHINLELQGTLELQRNSGISNNNIQNFEYRSGVWPGVFRITQKDGTKQNLHASNYKDGAYNYLSRLYYSKRCLYCIDGSSEMADISFADPWIQDAKGEWIYKGGWTLVFQRTEKGGHILFDANKDKAIFIEELYDYTMLKLFYKNIGNKRKMALVRLSRLKSRNKPVPEYRLGKPMITIKDRRKEFMYSMTLLISRYTILKHILMKILFSRIGILLTEVRIAIKYNTHNKNNDHNKFKEEI